MKSERSDSASLSRTPRSGRVSPPDPEDLALLEAQQASSGSPPSAPDPAVKQPPSRLVCFLQEFSIPLIVGVLVALAWANLNIESYEHFLHWVPESLQEVQLFHHGLFYFLVNDIFMVFFFGIAAKEITEAALPGGHLNPIRKAMNPLFATLGGVIGPVTVFFGLLALAVGMGSFEGMGDVPLERGWGIPTATDIALAWLVARTVFGAAHPAVGFLLLLAVADDAIGLGIIAIFYGDPNNPAEPAFLGLVLLGMALAFGMRKANIQSWVPYVLIAGPLAWSGLIFAHLHPALALVFIVPFLPGPKRDMGLFTEEEAEEQDAHGAEHSPLHDFEHQLKVPVDFGLFFFGIANAGVEFSGIGAMTWIILGSLVIGKTIGIGLLALLAKKLGFPLPANMGLREVFMAGFVAALGLTVALFVAGAAFPTTLDLQGQAKMGALFSGLVGIVAIVLGRVLGIKKLQQN